MRLLVSVLIVLLTFALVGCTYEKDVGSDERAKLRQYVEKAFDIEQEVTIEVGKKMEAEPILWDEAAGNAATPQEMIDAFTRYYSTALPHIAEAVSEFERLNPPETAELFHQSTLSALRGYEEVMESAISTFKRGDYQGMLGVFEKMDNVDASMESTRSELDRLLKITD